MKIEFIKKTDAAGVIYFTEIDGTSVIGSFNADEHKAKSLYDAIVARSKNKPVKEVLAWTELPDEKPAIDERLGFIKNNWPTT